MEALSPLPLKASFSQKTEFQRLSCRLLAHFPFDVMIAHIVWTPSRAWALAHGPSAAVYLRQQAHNPGRLLQRRVQRPCISKSPTSRGCRVHYGNTYIRAPRVAGAGRGDSGRLCLPLLWLLQLSNEL